MSTTLQLPASLQERLAGVARNVRLVRILRGGSLLVLALALLAGTAFLADHFLEHSLPAPVRGLLLAAWIGLGVLLTLSLGRSALHRLDPADLAAVVEEKYPELGERLTSSVELCNNASAGNGSPALIELLVRETEARTNLLDLGSVVSGRSTRWLAAIAALVLLFTLAPAAVAPMEYGRLAQRFFLPWQTPTPLPDYHFEVSPGDGFAARGRPVTITAHLSPRISRIELPRTSHLVVEAPDGSRTRHEMTATGETGQYTASFRVPGDVTYQVEAGNATSDRFALTAVTPVDLAEDSPTITVTPPAYAAVALESETLTGMVDVTALEHSKITLAFRFDRPAVAARIEWAKAEDKKEAKTLVPLALSEDGQSASHILVARQTGSYRLVLVAEHGVQTVREGGTITVRPDQPPAMLRYAGKEGNLAARAFDRVPLELRLADDIGVAGAALLWRVNDEKSIHEEKFQLDGAGSREATARHAFLLAGKVKEGDEVQFRVRFQDNRPREFGGPNVRHHPEEGWIRLRIVKQGRTLKEQDVLAQRDAVNKKLDAIRTELKQEQRRTMSVRSDSREQETLSDRNSEAVRELREQNQKTEKALQDLARELAEEPEQESLAGMARQVAQDEMRRADEGLRDTAERGAKPPVRERRLKATEDELGKALSKLDALQKANEKLARDRQDQARVEALADRQKQLADRAAELANKHPVLDPEAKTRANEVRREQNEVAQELKDLTEKSPSLQKALDEARAEQARQAADQARELARDQRELARASDATEKSREAERLTDLARRQKELASKTADLAKETNQPARANFARPLQPDDSSKAVDSLQKGETDKALAEQDRAARELDRLARDLDRALDLARDPREAARQLARLEEDLATKTRKEVARPDENRLRELERDQEAIRQAAQRLSVPPDRKDAQADKDRAAQNLEAAEKALAKNDPKEALAQMTGARQALRDLAQKLPTLQERQKQARTRLAELMRDQEDVARKARGSEREQAEAARKQAEIVQALGKLDGANQEERRDRVQEEATKALADLRDGRKADQPTSQAAARREMERLAQALAGQKPADEKAADLAREQRELARRAEKAAEDPTTSRTKRDEMRRAQRRLAEEARALDAREAPASKRETAEAASRAADEAVKEGPAGKRARQAMAEAAKKLEALARNLGGQEAEPEKARRLARQQAEEAARTAREGTTPTGDKRQQDLAEEAKNLRAGHQAAAEKQKADEALARAASAKPAEKGKAQRDAAEALARLADRLESAAKPDATAGSPRKQAEDLAREQAGLARATKAAREETAGKRELEQALEKVAQGQKDLAARAAKLPAGAEAKKTLEQARSAMDQARQALDRTNAAEAGRKQQEAAQALEQLAKQLPTSGSRPSSGTQASDKPPSALPSKEQAEAARRLAQEQRDLREAVQRAAEQARSERRADSTASKDNPTGKLAREQADIARETAKLASEVAREQGARSSPAQRATQANQATSETSRNLDAGALPRAQESGKSSAEQLRQLANELAKTGRGGSTPADPDSLEQARRLAQRQETVNKQLAPSAQSPSAQRAQQQARQEELTRRAGQLMRQLDELGKSSAAPTPGTANAREAARATRQAESSMQAARNQAQQGNQASAQTQREMAAQALERAASQAEQAARSSSPSSTPQAGRSVQEARGQMSQAQQQLNQNQPGSARGSMQQAARSLEQAAQQLAQALQPARPSEKGDPTAQGAAGGGTPDGRTLPRELAGYTGKRWGDLPGEVRTKIVQQMKAKYGEDYARMIKLYFEQIADTRRKR